MDNLLTVAFEAHDNEKNHHRRYQLTLGRDLFDDWTVTIGHGRIGRVGQESQFASPDAETIKTIIRNRLRRRLTAPRRIGCPYRMVSLDCAPALDATVWLSDDLIDRFGSLD